ncbi:MULTISPECIES: hypothetical protein [Phyllobacteriaceae]|jgi:hypothetical protein|uniref:Uncharacterized protein n=1 Tax=Mesorhizobium hungaricum TaxID=1566387 RepID=A0A1C2DD89_9HYPH|nr:MULTISPECIES: hypothetical protein [Mesorhizobium]MBN9235091.1 hypothetical protein [Mesorhizobium sp.]OCX12709.1 hypothetical protein QV13_24230 [Mesorhizobium hungaricum]
MALPLYPSELPAPLRDTYQIGFGEGRFKSKNDAGPGNVRGRFSSTVHSVPFSTLLDTTQVGRFRYFYFEETKEGKLPFLIPDHSGDSYVWLDDDETSLLYEDGTPILMAETWLVLFDSLPTIKPRDIYWTVSFTLVVMP